MPYKQKRIDDGIKRAALYARVSTEEQAMHGVSLDAQRERLLSYAKENGLTVVDTYVDEGISARKRYTRRPEFVRMLEDVKAKKIDIVLFIKLDRWFRNIGDYYEVQAILDKYKVQWVATEEDYDTTTANGRLALNIKLAIAQDESDRTSERIKFVFKNMVKEGRVISGQVPKGFKIVDKHVAVDEELAPIIREMFEMYLDFRAMKPVSRAILEKYGVNIDIKSMKSMLQNRWYVGEAYGIPGWCPQIIDNNTFELASNLVQTRAERYSKIRTDRVYLFTGLLFCGHCGRRMATYACRNHNQDGTVREFIYYRCTARNMHRCDMHKQFNQDTFEKWLVQNVRHEAELYNAELENRGKQAKRKTIDKSKVLAKIEKLKELYLNDLIPLNMYEADYRSLAALLSTAEEKEKEANLKPIDLKMFDDFAASYEKLDPEHRKAFWSRVIKKIVVNANGDKFITLNAPH